MSTLTALRALTFGAIATASIATCAQESKVRWKVNVNFEAAPEDGTVYHKVVRGDGGCIVALQVKGSSPVLGGLEQWQMDRTLLAYDSQTLNKIKFDKTKILWGEGPVAVETIEQFTHQFRVIATKPDPENGKLLLIQQVLSPRSLTGKGAQLLTAIPFDRLGKSPDYFKPNMAVGFTTTVSVDSTKMLIGLSPQTTTHGAGCPVFAQMFDKVMKLLWTNTLIMDASGSSRILDTRVDPKGAVWYLIKNVTNPAPKTKEDLGYSFSLYRLDSAGQKVVLLDLAGKEFAQDATMEMKPDGSIVVGGVYASEETNRSESVGVFHCILDAQAMKFDKFKLLPFDKQIIKKEEHWQSNMRIDHVWPKKNGGVFIVARKSGIETHYVADLSGKKFPKTEQVDGAVHIWETDASGDQKWYRVLDHELSFDNDVPGTIISLCYEDVLFVLLNDNDSNNEKRKLKAPVDPITSSKDALLFEFKPDGTDKAKVVLKDGYKQMGLQPMQVWRTAPGEIVTTGAIGFAKDKNWPVVIEMYKDAKK